MHSLTVLPDKYIQHREHQLVAAFARASFINMTFSLIYLQSSTAPPQLPRRPSQMTPLRTSTFPSPEMLQKIK